MNQLDFILVGVQCRQMENGNPISAWKLIEEAGKTMASLEAFLRKRRSANGYVALVPDVDYGNKPTEPNVWWTDANNLAFQYRFLWEARWIELKKKRKSPVAKPEPANTPSRIFNLKED